MKFSVNPNMAGVGAIAVGGLNMIATGKWPLPDYIPPHVVHVIQETNTFIVNSWTYFGVAMICFLSSDAAGVLAKVGGKPADLGPPPAPQLRG